MRDTHGKKWEAQNQEYGYDRSEHEEWNTYAAEELKESEMSDMFRLGFHVCDEESERRVLEIDEEYEYEMQLI